MQKTICILEVQGFNTFGWSTKKYAQKVLNKSTVGHQKVEAWAAKVKNDLHN